MQIDPINSPHPVPWNWILAAQGSAAAAAQPQTHYYRSASLRSPDHQWIAYSRICLQATPQLHSCQVSSVLLVENLSTGSLQGVQPPLPLDLCWEEPPEESPEESLKQSEAVSSQAQGDQPQRAGAIGLLVPISWNYSSDRLLTRNFKGAFCSSLASDYALVWDSHTHTSQTLAPYNVAYEYAVLQGWSQTDPDQVLFKTGKLGDPEQHLWRVDRHGHAVPSAFDQAEILGQIVTTPLEGPQALRA
jgi:hypothetical protein